MLIGCCGNTVSYDTISRMGYDYIELAGGQLMTLSDAEFLAFAAHTKEVGFPTPSINAYTTGDHPLVGPDWDPEDVRGYARALCQRAAILDVKGIGIGAPAARRLPEGFDPEEADRQMKQTLQIIAEEAARYGIQVLLEALHRYTCEYLNDTDRAAALVRELALPNLYLVYDWYHAEVMGEDYAPMHAAMPLIRHLHYSSDLGEDHARGFVTEEKYEEFRTFLAEARKDGYDDKISVEADGAWLERDGAECAVLMRRAME